MQDSIANRCTKRKKKDKAQEMLTNVLDGVDCARNELRYCLKKLMKIIKEETKRCTLVKDRLQDLFRAARTVDENQIKMQNDDDDESCRCEAQTKEMR